MTENSKKILIYRIRANETLFLMSSKTIEKFPASEFYEAIMSDVNQDYYYPESGLVVLDNTTDMPTIYVDIDDDSIKTIISYMRAYPNINNNHLNISDKVVDDARKIKIFIDIQKKTKLHNNKDTCSVSSNNKPDIIDVVLKTNNFELVDLNNVDKDSEKLNICDIHSDNNLEDYAEANEIDNIRANDTLDHKISRNSKPLGSKKKTTKLASSKPKKFEVK